MSGTHEPPAAPAAPTIQFTTLGALSDGHSPDRIPAYPLMPCADAVARPCSGHELLHAAGTETHKARVNPSRYTNAHTRFSLAHELGGDLPVRIPYSVYPFTLKEDSSILLYNKMYGMNIMLGSDKADVARPLPYVLSLFTPIASSVPMAAWVVHKNVVLDDGTPIDIYMDAATDAYISGSMVVYHSIPGTTAWASTKREAVYSGFPLFAVELRSVAAVVGAKDVDDMIGPARREAVEYWKLLRQGYDKRLAGSGRTYTSDVAALVREVRKGGEGMRLVDTWAGVAAEGVDKAKYPSPAVAFHAIDAEKVEQMKCVNEIHKISATTSNVTQYIVAA